MENPYINDLLLSYKQKAIKYGNAEMTYENWILQECSVLEHEYINQCPADEQPLDDDIPGFMMENATDFEKFCRDAYTNSTFKQIQTLENKGMEEEKKMTESQSRYGIMEQLNNRKLNEKEKLANLEQEKRQTIIEFEKQLNQHVNGLLVESQNYKLNHESWKRAKIMEMEDLEKNMNARIGELKAEIQNKDDNLEPEHNKKVEQLQLMIDSLESNNKIYLEKQSAKIVTKEETITEIEKAITDLKEMSAEQTEKK